MAQKKLSLNEQREINRKKYEKVHWEYTTTPGAVLKKLLKAEGLSEHGYFKWQRKYKPSEEPVATVANLSTTEDMPEPVRTKRPYRRRQQLPTPGGTAGGYIICSPDKLVELVSEAVREAVRSGKLSTVDIK